MIEVTAILSLAVQHWIDFVIIMVLLIYNAGIGFWQECKAANALAALKKGLAPKAHVERDGVWSMIDAAGLVPGDVVRLRLGAMALSKKKAIVSRLEDIEKMAEVDILCSDKTGTLTKNQLTLDDPVVFGDTTPEACILAGALASKKENDDAIDLAVIAGVKDPSTLAV